MERVVEVNGALMAKQGMPSLSIKEYADVLFDGEARGGSAL